MNKLFAVGVLLMLVCGGVFVYENIYKTSNESIILYQGAVPLGYDLEHFRQTGETILEKESNG